jgi:hypothetical protein
MKKVIIILILVIGGWFVYRSMNKQEARPTRAELPAASNSAVEKAIPQSQALAGKNFNAVFPASGDGLSIAFTQEKDGYAQADLTKGGKKLAQLSISDTATNPAAKEKFKNSVKQLGGFPMAPVGSQGSALLVAGRYQVQVRSLDPSITAAEREKWLEKFKLPELARR